VPTPDPLLSVTQTVSRKATDGHPHAEPLENKPVWAHVPDVNHKAQSAKTYDFMDIERFKVGCHDWATAEREVTQTLAQLL
jgi:hypothetical protein